MNTAVDSMLRMMAQANKPTISKKQSDQMYERMICMKKRRDANVHNLRMSAILDSEKNTGNPQINGRSKEKCQREIQERAKEIIDLRKKKIQQIKAATTAVQEKKIQKECTFTPKINKSRAVSRSNSTKKLTPSKKQPLQSKSPSKIQSKSPKISVSKSQQLLMSFDQFTMSRSRSQKRVGESPCPSPKVSKNNSRSQLKKPQPADDFERQVISVKELTSARPVASAQVAKPPSKSPSRGPGNKSTKISQDKENYLKQANNPQPETLCEFYFEEQDFSKSQSTPVDSKPMLCTKELYTIIEEQHIIHQKASSRPRSKSPIQDVKKSWHSKVKQPNRKSTITDEVLHSILNRNVCQR